MTPDSRRAETAGRRVVDLHGAHDFRHTFSTWLEDAGIPARIIDDLMGHQASGRTGRHRGSAIGAHYRHTTPEMATRVVAAVEERLVVVVVLAMAQAPAGLIRPRRWSAGSVAVPWAGVQSGSMSVAEDGVAWLVTSDGQDWRVAWHPPPEAPPGTPHGSAGVCVAGDAVVLVSGDGDRWGLPGGRPEPGEEWADTLRREVREEACATVTACRLLGFNRGVCVRGSGAGLVLVRALWRAEVRLDPWQPRFEIAQRRLVPVAEAFDSIWIEDGFGPLYRRIFLQAALPVGP